MNGTYDMTFVDLNTELWSEMLQTSFLSTTLASKAPDINQDCPR